MVCHRLGVLPVLAVILLLAGRVAAADKEVTGTLVKADANAGLPLSRSASRYHSGGTSDHGRRELAEVRRDGQNARPF
jgi:hypothetical protein